MRIAFMIMIAATHASALPLAAQTAGEREPALVARRFIDGQLSDSAFRHQRCVSARFGDCPDGVRIVRGYKLGEGVRTRDTVRYAVEFQFIGSVGVSEAAPFFMPHAWVDSGEVVVVHRGGRWSTRSPRRRSGEPVRTTADVARGFFQFDAEDRGLIDSALAVPRRP